MSLSGDSLQLRSDKWLSVLDHCLQYLSAISVRDVLPTNGTAKFFSPLSVDDFIKKSSIIYYSREALSEIHEDIESFAKSESLTAHANSIAVRFEGEE